MRALIVGLTVGFYGLLSVVPAHAAWVEARSDNFVFVGDTSEKKATKIVQELEEYRAIIFKLFNVEASVEVMPVHIYAPRSSRAIKDMTGMENAAGVYRNARDGPVFVLNIRGGFTDKSPAKAIALHEYTHHLLSQYTGQMYPRWVNEGMAEYLSTFTANDKGLVKIGLPREGRGHTLANYKWMDMDVLTGAIRRYPYPNESGRRVERVQALFYAQSWLAIHYIQSTDGMSDKLKQYVAGIPSADNPQDYFTDIFGMTPDAFGDQLKTYFKKNRYLNLRITLDETLDSLPVATRKLTKGEAEFYQGEAIRRFRRSAEGRELAAAYYARAEQNDGPLAQIEASRALLAITAKDMTTALVKAKKARDLDPDDGRVLHIYAKALVADYENDDTPTSEAQMTDARAAFKSALRADPDNMETHFDYVMTYALTGDPASKQAIYSAKESTYYYRASRFFGSNMRLVPILIDNDAPDFARIHLERASLWAPRPSLRRRAKKLLETLPEPKP